MFDGSVQYKIIVEGASWCECRARLPRQTVDTKTVSRTTPFRLFFFFFQTDFPQTDRRTSGLSGPNGFVDPVRGADTTDDGGNRTPRRLVTRPTAVSDFFSAGVRGGASKIEISPVGDGRLVNGKCGRRVRDGWRHGYIKIRNL